MAYNRLVHFERGWSQTYPNPNNSGSIVLGENDLLNGKDGFFGGSEGLCGIAVDPSGNVYCSDSKEHIIIKTTPSGQVSTYAGKAGTWGNNGANTVTAYDARFKDPGGVACDRSGNLYVADVGNNQIRKIDPNRNVSLVAGDPLCSSGFVNGAWDVARFSSPYDVAPDRAGNIWVADTWNHAIRVINRGSKVWTAAGNGTAGDAIGHGDVARFTKPYGVACSPNGGVYVTDSGNHKVKLIDQSFFVHHFSGSGAAGWFIGDAWTSSYQTLKFCDVDPSGNLYVIDFDPPPSVMSRLLLIDLNGNPHTIAQWTDKTQYVIGVACSLSGSLFVVESIDTEFESSSSQSSASSDSSTEEMSTSFSQSSVSSASSLT